MTDLASSFVSGSQFDVTNLDENIRQISAVESTWRLPKLPDEVKLELAAYSQLDARQTAEFLTGIDRDFAGEDEPGETPEDVPLQPAQRIEQRPRSGFDQTRVIAADIFNRPAPTRPDVDAVTKFKMRAIERGYLDRSETGVVDNRWNPGLNGVLYDMAYDDYQRRISGEDSIDSISTRTAVDLIADWTQPGHLLAAAADLDLVWNPKGIWSETTNWLDKWRKVGKSKNPFEFGKNMLDAVLGPVDDIAMPILTWAAILGSGGSAAWALAPKAFIASRGGRAGAAFLGVANRFAPTSRAALALPSATATRLGRSSGAARQAVGGAMAAWRATEPVIAAKRALQPGIRLGVLGQAQGLADFDGTRGARLSQLAPVQGVQQSMRDFSESWWSLPAELLIAPQNYFNPRTFVGRGSAGADAVRQLGRLGGNVGRTAVGTVAGAGAGAWLGDDFEDTLIGAAAGGAGGLLLPKAGRALGNPNVSSVATGAIAGGLGGTVFALLDDMTNEGEGSYDLWDAALAGAATGAVVLGAKSALLKKPGKNRFVGFVSDVARKSEFEAVTQDHTATIAFHEALFARSDSYREAFERSDGSFTSAWKLWQGGDDATIGAEMMSWFTQYAIHRAAKIASNAGGYIDDANYGQYLKVREKLIAQLRQVNADQSVDGILDEVARRMANGVDDPAAWARYRDQLAADPQRAMDWVAHHNRLSAKFTKQIFGMASELGQTSPAAADWLRSLEAMDPNAFDEFGEYIARNIDSVGGWANYNAQMSELSRLQYDMRVLDGIHLKQIDLYGGLSYEPKGGRTLIAKDDATASDSVFQTLLREDAPVQLTDAVDPVSGVQNPNGRTVLARKATVTGNEMEERAVRYNFYRNLYEMLDQVKPINDQVAAKLDQFDSITEHQVRGVLSAAGVDGNSRDIMRLHEWARSQGVSWSQLQKKLDEVVQTELSDPDFWARMGVDPMVRTSGHGRHARALDVTDPMEARVALRERARQLYSRARYTAHEVDWERQVADLREAGRAREADELEAFVRAADDNGYKLVHGVDFVLPTDLAKMDSFHDITRRHTNAMSIGNFFEGKLPAIAHANQERRQRAAIAEKLHDIGRDIDPEDDWVTRAVADVRDILTRIQDEVADTIAEIRTQGIMQRTGTRIASTGTPLRPEDLGGASKAGNRLKHELRKIGYSEEEVQAIWKAVPKFRNAEFRDVGLYSLEASLRERNQLAGALKWGMRGTTGAIGGFYMGAAIGAATSDEESARQGQIIGGAVGALLGGAAGAVVGRSGAASRAIDWAERARYGYLADGLARMRDTLRFSLSPMFDLSRYTEGYTLGQAAAPLRGPDGSRFVMPANASPSGFRKRLKAAEGLSDVETERRWRETLDEFRAAARGDFDPQELDSAGRWFAQVGILGFNPTDWMASAFGEFRRAGFSSEQAYHHARAMYTYGTKGRSAAEMSVNFIVFPFSFQKKALGHVASWINDDLSRAWLIHDGFKAYEALSEQYNLDEVWREHLPALQQLRRLNMFAYGISPGQWGGVNARILEPAAKMGSELSAQLFAPQAFQIGGEGGIDWGKVGSAAEIQDLYKSLVPAINDMNWMIANAKDQLEVGFSPTHQTRRAAISSAWEQWNEFKRAKEDELEAMGASWSEMQRSPIFADHRAQVMAFRANLDSKFPHWAESYASAIANSIALDMERTDRLTRITQNLDTATPMDEALAVMDGVVAEEREILRATGYDTGGSFTWVDAPVESHMRVRQRAVQFLQQDRRFAQIWDKFFADQFGPIESEI